MLRSIVFRGVLAVAFGMVAGSANFAAAQQNQDSGQDKHLDIQSSAGDLHLATTRMPEKPDCRSTLGRDCGVTKRTAARLISASLRRPLV